MVADTISRLNMGDGYCLNANIFHVISNVSEYPTMDRFASALNTMLPLFNSYFMEYGSSGVDAFAQNDYL